MKYIIRKLFPRNRAPMDISAHTPFLFYVPGERNLGTFLKAHTLYFTNIYLIDISHLSMGYGSV